MFSFAFIPGVFAADTFIKKKIEAAPEGSLPQETLGGRLTICRSHNYGMMLNAMDKNPELVKKITAGSFLSLCLWYLFFCLPGKSRLKKLGGALLLGGAASNTLDHLKRGYVVDYLKFSIKPIRKIAFNLSDFSIFAGCGMLLAKELFHKDGEEKMLSGCEKRG